MENQLVKSPLSDEIIADLSTATNTDLHITSWKLFSVLLDIGRPVPPVELASRYGMSPEFVEFVCSIADSPLSLRSDGFVTVSSGVYIGLKRFLLNSSRVVKFVIPREMDNRDSGRKRSSEDVERKYQRKRRRSWSNVWETVDQAVLALPLRIQNACAKQVHVHVDDVMGKNNGTYESERDMNMIMHMAEIGGMNSGLQYSYGCTHFPSTSGTILGGGVKDCIQFQSVSHLIASSILKREDIEDKRSMLTKSPIRADDENRTISLVMAGTERDNKSQEKQKVTEEREHASGGHKGNIGNLPTKFVCRDLMVEFNFEEATTLSCYDMVPYSSSGKKESCQEVKKITVSQTEADKLCADETKLVDLQDEERVICGREEKLVDSHLGEGDPESPKIIMDVPFKNDCKKGISIRRNNTNTASELKDKRPVFVKQKLKPNCEPKMHTGGKRENIKEIKEKPTSISVKDNSEPRVVPTFDSFIVEEEEGSGGYGTVYKARKKNDGTTFAVKYPHVNANRHHVHNEIKMLERFGGKNFVIKYEGSFKSGNAHCLVLEHVAHDRPEVLKREIDVYQLRWYAYCLFKALAGLHKQGVVHRDVKPGNFLFSRKTSKGYLIDFNLATDLHQKYGSTEKSKANHDANFGRSESLPPTKTRKIPSSKALEQVKHEAGTLSKLPLPPKNSKKKTYQLKENMRGVMKSQGADGSGITSTKDATSSRVPSADRLREPIPCKGRKELLNLVHEAMQGPDHEVASAPSSKRKRVAAPPTKLDKKFFYLSPMPLQSTGIAVAGAGLFHNKGEGKQRREGPCVGTKGFRAPEVLFKSTYQGPKVDIWSAGVTLLYLIIGRTPFVGDPDQNIKEIAKLRGSEDLWEVAKLHDCESSFPSELFDIQSLPSTKLREWCKQNTRRPDFLDVIPRSLVDLVDKCLTVNPRSRISAEDALRHEFFVPCLEGIKKQRLLRQGLGVEPGTELPNTQHGEALS